MGGKPPLYLKRAESLPLGWESRQCWFQQVSGNILGREASRACLSDAH